MLYCKVVLPIVGERLVECSVVLLRDVLRIASPDGLLLIDQLPLVTDFLDLFLLLVLLFVVIVVNLSKQSSSDN